MTVAEIGVLLGVDAVEAQSDRMMAERMKAQREGRPAPSWGEI